MNFLSMIGIRLSWGLLILRMGIVTVAFLGGCRPPLAETTGSVQIASVAVSAQDNTLGPGDVFDVRVFGEKELSATYRVASDGTIDFPLIGQLTVGGLTPSDARTLIEKMLFEGDFLKKPQVSILVKEYSSKKVSVFGQVNRPGTFSWLDGMSIVQAISLAGGFTPMAKTDNTMVTRMVNGQKQNFVVPVEKIGEGKVSDFILSPGDNIFVPKRVF